MLVIVGVSRDSHGDHQWANSLVTTHLLALNTPTAIHRRHEIPILRTLIVTTRHLRIQCLPPIQFLTAHGPIEDQSCLIAMEL
jgi:hypothetical protein